MTHTAYLVAHFEITDKGKPKFLGTAIYSEGGNMLTGGISRRRFACTVLEVRGDTYHDAHKRLRSLRKDPSTMIAFGWAFDALTERRKSKKDVGFF